MKKLRDEKGRFTSAGAKKWGFKKGNKLGKKFEKGHPYYGNAESRRKISEALKGKLPKNMRNWKGKNHPLYGKKRPEISGEKNWNWRGGVTSLRQKIYHSLEYKKWREKIFERDNYTCQWCGKKGTYLEAHHKERFYKIMIENKIDTFEKALNCEKLWDIGIGITLCKKCHNLTKFFVANQYVRRK